MSKPPRVQILILLVAVTCVAVTVSAGCSVFRDLDAPLQQQDGGAPEDVGYDTRTDTALDATTDLREGVDTDAEVSEDADVEVAIDVSEDADVEVATDVSEDVDGDLPLPDVLEGIVFEPAMATRSLEGGPAEVAPIFQGDLSRVAGGVSDRVVVEPNDDAKIGGFWPTGDPRQGTLVAWVTPEWSYSDLDEIGVPLFAYGNVVVSATHSGLRVWPGEAPAVTLTETIDNWVAGDTYLVVLRWRTDRTLLGLSSHWIADIDSGRSFRRYEGHSRLVIGWPQVVLGAGSADGVGRGANAAISGFTAYRRVLWDGSVGTDLGNGDELARIYRGGAGLDPTEVTGSWDVVLSVPTIQTAGELKTRGQAWRHPFDANKLGAAGFFESSLEGWHAVDGDLTFAVEPEEAVYASALKLTSDDGHLEKRVPVGSHKYYIVRALAHSVHSSGRGGGAPDIAVACDDEQPFAWAVGTENSTRTSPDVLTLAVDFSDRTDCQNLVVWILNFVSATRASVYWDQIEVIPSLVANGGFRRWDDGHHFAVDWTVHQTLDPAGFSQATEAPVGTSGPYHLHIAADASESGRLYPGFLQTTAEESLLTDGSYYSVGASFRRGSANAMPQMDVTNGSLFSTMSNAKFHVEAHRSGQSWQRVMGVGIRWRGEPAENSHNDLLFFGGRDVTGAQDQEALDIDDAYYVELPEVILDVRPASLYDSLGETDVLRLDGLDQASVPVDFAAETDGIALTMRAGRPVGEPVAACEGPYHLFSLVSTGGAESIGVAVDDATITVRVKVGEAPADSETFTTPASESRGMVMYHLSYSRDGTITLTVGSAVPSVMGVSDALRDALDQVQFDHVQLGILDEAGLLPCDTMVQLPIEVSALQKK